MATSALGGQIEPIRSKATTSGIFVKKFRLLRSEWSFCLSPRPELQISALSPKSGGSSDMDGVCEEEAGLQSDKT